MLFAKDFFLVYKQDTAEDRFEFYYIAANDTRHLLLTERTNTRSDMFTNFKLANAITGK